jgi:hypothetical protein
MTVYFVYAYIKSKDAEKNIRLSVSETVEATCILRAAAFVEGIMFTINLRVRYVFPVLHLKVDLYFRLVIATKIREIYCNPRTKPQLSALT